MSDKHSPPSKMKPEAAKKAGKPNAPAHARKFVLQADLSEEDAWALAEAKNLTANEELFAQAYLANGLNATQAYMAVHPKAKRGTATVEGSRTLAKTHVLRRVRELVAERSKKLEIDGEELLRHTHAVATADHRHLTQYRYFNCPYCRGLDHRRQRTLAQFEDDRRRHEDEERKREAHCVIADKAYVPDDFDEEGGPGFNECAAPVEDCPNCFGNGVGRTVIADTSKVPADAAILFAGVKETKDGVEVKFHDKLTAQSMLFKHKGLFEADNAQQAAATSPEALAAMAAAMEVGRAKQLQKLAERRATGFSGD
ncbi:terminase small subunit [Ramlibacter sp.]|uniref:terminase small subunit n=1 Tax=Ramlibacter sp. TaxID=1917967 RepID=UPI002604632B|nr:terminase small subunit [Ramlibacter sp.]MDB5957511.1 hypothetical protein [Ramlibacter sp.]